MDKFTVYYIGENNIPLDKHEFKLPQTPVAFFHCQLFFLVAFVKNNATMSSKRYFENHVSVLCKIDGNKPY